MGVPGVLFQRCESSFFAGIIAGCAAIFCHDILIGVLVAVLSIAVAAIFSRSRKKIFYTFLAGVCAGSISAFIQTQLNYSRVENGEFSVENIEVKLTDPRLCDVPDIRNPRLIRAEVEKPFQAAVFCRFPAGTRDHFRYGERLTGKAYLVPVDSITGGFDNYLRSRKVQYIVHFREAHSCGVEPTLYGQLLFLRDGLIARCVSYFQDRSLKNIAAALFFGISGGVEDSDRKSFVDSGTVHLFSVSGMHVAVVAALMLLISRCFGYRTGYLLLIAACGFYTLATGANTPALRAFFMISVWAVLRINYLWMRPLDIMSLCGALFLLINPFLFADTGAQYSFVITAALLLTADRFSTGVRRERRLEELSFGAARNEEKKLRIDGNPVAALLSVPLTAFFAGAGITLLRGGRFFFGQIVANILLLFLTLPLFVLLIFCCIFPPLGVLAENCLFLLRSWCAFCAELIPPLPAGELQIWVTAAYYILLFIMLSRKKLYSSVLLALPALALLFCPLLTPKRDMVMVITSDSKTPPCVLFCDGQSGTAEIVNIPTFSCAKHLSRELRKRGIGAVDALHAGSNKVGDIDSLNYLDPDLAPEKIFISGCGKSGVNSRIVNYLQTKCQRSDAVNAAMHPGKCQVFPSKTGLEIEYFFSGSKLKIYLKIDKGEKFWRISCRSDSGAEVEVVRKFGVPETVWSYEF